MNSLVIITQEACVTVTNVRWQNQLRKMEEEGQHEDEKIHV